MLGDALGLELVDALGFVLVDALGNVPGPMSLLINL